MRPFLRQGDILGVGYEAMNLHCVSISSPHQSHRLTKKQTSQKNKPHKAQTSQRAKKKTNPKKDWSFLFQIIYRQQ